MKASFKKTRHTKNDVLIYFQSNVNTCVGIPVGNDEKKQRGCTEHSEQGILCACEVQSGRSHGVIVIRGHVSYVLWWMLSL